MKKLFAIITKYSEENKRFYQIKTKWVSVSKINSLQDEIGSRQQQTKDIYRVFLFESYTDQKYF